MSPFTKAKLVLTFWYVVLLCVVTASFSLVLYSQISSIIDQQYMRLEHRVLKGNMPMMPEEFGPPKLFAEELVDIKQEIAFHFLLINGGLMIIFASGAYFLAGKTLDPIQKMYEKQKLFVATAAHELRTPLSTIRTGIELFAQKKTTSKKEKQDLEETLEDVDHLSSLVSQLLTLARYQREKNEHDSVFLEKAIQAAVRMINPLAKEKNISLEIDPISKTAQVSGVSHMVTELLIILLENAIAHSKPNSKITVFIREQRSRYVIGVVDAGPGISRLEQTKIFEPFYQGKKGSKSNSVGLGLAIAKELAIQLKSNISVTSELNKGSVFSFTLGKISS